VGVPIDLYSAHGMCLPHYDTTLPHTYSAVDLIVMYDLPTGQQPVDFGRTTIFAEPIKISVHWSQETDGWQVRLDVDKAKWLRPDIYSGWFLISWFKLCKYLECVRQRIGSHLRYQRSTVNPRNMHSIKGEEVEIIETICRHMGDNCRIPPMLAGLLIGRPFWSSYGRRGIAFMKVIHCVCEVLGVDPVSHFNNIHPKWLVNFHLHPDTIKKQIVHALDLGCLLSHDRLFDGLILRHTAAQAMKNTDAVRKMKYIQFGSLMPQASVPSDLVRHIHSFL
jgi:hypothetical protein